jgi:acyl carrier protein
MFDKTSLELEPQRSQERIEEWLVTRFAQLADVEPDAVDVDKPFADYSLDSSVAVTVALELSRWLDRELSQTVFWEHPTIRALARILAESPEAGRDDGG